VSSAPVLGGIGMLLDVMGVTAEPDAAPAEAERSDGSDADGSEADTGARKARERVARSADGDCSGACLPPGGLRWQCRLV